MRIMVTLIPVLCKLVLMNTWDVIMSIFHIPIRIRDHTRAPKMVACQITRPARTSLIEIRIRKLFPIRLADFDAIQKWECFDADSGNDLAVELREYCIPDFSGWKEHDAFERAFDGLLRDLKAEEKTSSS
jgi:hypothetical protein